LKDQAILQTGMFLKAGPFITTTKYPGPLIFATAGYALMEFPAG
jgi:hypothetical protein